MRKYLLISIIMLMIFYLQLQAGKTVQLTLDNGMVVILKENHSTAMVSSIVCVRAGSKFEDQSNNGFTHFLEHLLFNGTKNRSRLELNEGFKEHGGYINAFTRKDLTGYLFVIPSKFVEYALDAQADQLFNSTLPEEEFPKERKIVIEEIKMNNDDPEYRAEMFFDSLIYQGTPYTQTVLGYKDIIASIPREKVWAYYKERYVPNNMIALFIGDFQADAFARLIDKYYGIYPPGKLPKQPTYKINPPYSKKIYIKEFPTDVTYVHIVFPAPRYEDPDYYSIDVLCQILDAGETSPLYKVLTKGDDPLITSMSIYLETQHDFSLLHFSANTNDPRKVERIVTLVSRFFTDASNLPIDKKQLKRIVVKNKTDQIYLEEKLHYYGVIQAPKLVNCGYNFILRYVQNLSRVKPQDIQKAAGKYFSQRKYLAMAMVPPIQEEN
ncbi:MAG: hypothetical protein B6D58_06150 [candidate division Zixibacteria bacterium 4484_95]|nr:MAG: hypothetical protein B6D58_06150 [candidate division Zixibacteria bacterium 4484_95]RKX17544.1 MAG: hypothetical protein DRP26_06755 [candidate division Zixibacteria bacterium]